MAVETLNYGGINRAVSDYGNPGSCEELINLRPTTEGLVPVKDFVPKFSDLDFYRVFVHRAVGRDVYLALRRTSSGVSAVVLNSSGGVASTLFTVAATTDAKRERIVEGTSFAYAGNVVLFSVCDASDGIYENHAFTWNGTSYAATEADVPEITFSFGEEYEEATAKIPKIDASTEPAAVVDAVSNAMSAVQEQNPGICFGPVVVATAIRTRDGNTFWTSNWAMYDPADSVKSTSPSTYVDASNCTPLESTVYADFFADHGHGYRATPYYQNVDSFKMAGMRLKVHLNQVQGWNEGTSLLESVEVYASKPEPYADASAAFEGLRFDGSNAGEIILPQRSYEDMDLGKKLLYRVASVPLSSLSQRWQEVELRFGGNLQAAEPTLRVDAGPVERFGRVLSYNSRFHYYGSVAKTRLSMPHFEFDWGGQERTERVFVTFDDGTGSRTEMVGTATLPADAERMRAVIAAPIAVEQVATMYEERVTGMNYDYVRYWRYYNMDRSGSYNFSIHVGPCDTDDFSDETAAWSGSAVEYVTVDEPAAVNVSERYDPFVFRVDHSYLAPGTILDVVPQLYVVTDATYGREPLDVFTDRGVYALVQGNGEVLYSSFEPITGKVAKRGAVPTETGIFFIADGALWLCAGRRATLVSDALHLGPHKYLRACTGYKEIAGTDADYSPDPAPANPAYDVSAFLSKVPFKTYAEGARLSFNRFRMEIFVSNPSYAYTYVLSLKYRQWFKISRTVWQDEPSSEIAATPGGTAGRITVLDLANEVEGGTALVHMQSRPFSFGYRYSHVHRMVAMTRADLSATGLLVAALYGSDDLQTWKLLAHSAKEGVKVSQMRTASSARSWRYYVVCTGGDAPLDTDFGPFLVDVAPVARRIG